MSRSIDTCQPIGGNRSKLVLCVYYVILPYWPIFNISYIMIRYQQSLWWGKTQTYLFRYWLYTMYFSWLYFIIRCQQSLWWDKTQPCSFQYWLYTMYFSRGFWIIVCYPLRVVSRRKSDVPSIVLLSLPNVTGFNSKFVHIVNFTSSRRVAGAVVQR